MYSADTRSIFVLGLLFADVLGVPFVTIGCRSPPTWTPIACAVRLLIAT